VSIHDKTSISFKDDSTTFVPESTPGFVVPVGATAIAKSLFRHEPPTAGEIEQAIDQVEDALAATGLKQAVRGDLHTRERQLIELLEVRAEEGRVAREEVEARFQQLAAIALGTSRPSEMPQLSAKGAAMLLILRECMHHLGYEAIQCERDPAQASLRS
jgi:hypothetical protein